jgi:hypothetical protein
MLIPMNFKKMSIPMKRLLYKEIRAQSHNSKFKKEEEVASIAHQTSLFMFSSVLIGME